MSSIYDPKVNEGIDYLCCNSAYAIDGDKSPRTGSDFLCAHTAVNVNQQQSWWAVDLQNVYDISVIDIYGRTDCCPDHLANFDVEVIMPACTCNRWNSLDEGVVFHCHYQATASQRITITCPPNTRGRFVRIKHLSRTAYACGHIGYGYVGPVIGTYVANSDVHCTEMCFTNTACSAAEYDKKTNVCILKGDCTNGTQSSLFQDNNKDVFFIQ
ncbi:uncharacterized protein [Mytilus edulis]|uniref:uncharacterized protein isoform X2 n=1 Tax=Mytilus edulis TaxID=6550 RepID=UPI0039EF8852